MASEGSYVWAMSRTMSVPPGLRIRRASLRSALRPAAGASCKTKHSAATSWLDASRPVSSPLTSRKSTRLCSVFVRARATLRKWTLVSTAVTVAPGKAARRHRVDAPLPQPRSTTFFTSNAAAHAVAARDRLSLMEAAAAAHASLRTSRPSYAAWSMAHVASGAHTDAKTPPKPTFPKEWMRSSYQYGVLVLSSSSSAAAFNLCVSRRPLGVCAT
mmetsp:Transcript_8993/g.26136  ORF Transcript_8993/g.26136 Transcript_8993/m.26136 type:complete len:215 (-) Transcript_8993:161-805(-)